MTSKGTVVLHIGLPKTGTTALQNWCAAMRSELEDAGIIYPATAPSPYVRKHQYIIEELRASTNARLKSILESAQGRTIALSTEGLSNQFWDLSQGQLVQFRSALAGFEVKVFVVARKPEAWLKSYYKQCLINPSVPEYPYATKLALEDFARIERVRFFCELPHKTKLLSAAFGAEEVVRSTYEDGWFVDWCDLLGWPPKNPDLPAVNESLNDETIDFVLAVNRLDLPPEHRALLLGLLHRELNSTHTMLRLYSDGISSPPNSMPQYHAALDALTAQGGGVADVAHRVRTQLEFLDGTRPSAA